MYEQALQLDQRPIAGPSTSLSPDLDISGTRHSGQGCRSCGDEWPGSREEIGARLAMRWLCSEHQPARRSQCLTRPRLCGMIHLMIWCMGYCIECTSIASSEWRHMKQGLLCTSQQGHADDNQEILSAWPRAARSHIRNASHTALQSLRLETCQFLAERLVYSSRRALTAYHLSSRRGYLQILYRCHSLSRT